MPGYKYPNIDLGATPIRSAGRAPDRKTISRKNSTRREEEDKEKFEPMIDSKYPTIASGATPIGSAIAHPMKNNFEKEQGRKFRVHGLNISLPSGERIQESEDFRKSKN
jgi:hypothetical protein